MIFEKHKIRETRQDMKIPQIILKQASIHSTKCILDWGSIAPLWRKTTFRDPPAVIRRHYIKSPKKHENSIVRYYWPMAIDILRTWSFAIISLYEGNKPNTGNYY
jgi:hypothetical protein